MSRRCTVAFRSCRALVALALGLAVVAPSGEAGALPITLTEGISADLGLVAQGWLLVSTLDQDADGDFEWDKQFRVRRGRLRGTLEVTKYAAGTVQFDTGAPDGGTGLDGRIIDAFAVLKPLPYLWVFGGLHLSPASRQNMTLANTLMAGDHPSMTWKSLTWGTRALPRFGSSPFAAADGGLRGTADARDLGATIFGFWDLGPELHLKAYLGAYEGVLKGGNDIPRFTARVQLNLFDAEPGFVASSTYFGAKKTVGIGLSYDMQPGVAKDADGSKIDYHFVSADVFAELPLGPGAWTVEGGFEWLSLGGSKALDHDADAATAALDVRSAEGVGAYLQTGYTIHSFQPWLLVERWFADRATGSYLAARAGITYAILGHNANLKLAYELFRADEPMAPSKERMAHSVLLGAYVSY